MLGFKSFRVELLPLILLNHDHKQAYSLIDISLDTFPYAGTTTTCESLYMVVPCVTMGGSVHAHHAGVSLLSAVGLEHLVAKTEDEYIRLATQLASNATALSNLIMDLQNLSLILLCEMDQNSLMGWSPPIKMCGEGAVKRGRLEEQVKQHNKKREAATLEGKGPQDDDNRLMR
uniref:Probable UDP-N-acetylglucosamine--peptide N-acetylglucosaminyltransferase SPINDLY n=1 Tax=Tanacetum cinerariifolium TaxID=118510 RepID=A0A699H724_TANCI|nr:probable UDP-N-acetylglucosamine--peptide N-acetylglucosaminyltransferase SPINDLY [Tanacetum cinerariifolium]